MAATVFKIVTVPPLESTVFAINMASQNVAATEGFIEGCGTIFKDLMTEQFASEGALAGGWAALSSDYAARKPGGLPIGVLSGALRDAMTGGAGYTEHVSRGSGDFGLGGGPAEEYGKYFSGGGKGPERPVVKWGESESMRFVKWGHMWLHEQLAVIGGHASSNMANPSLLGGLV